MHFSAVPEILDDLRQGKIVVLVDDENRENEGDLVCAAEKVTPEIIIPGYFKFTPCLKPKHEQPSKLSSTFVSFATI